MNKNIKVYLACTGVGIINRGIETFACECFYGLQSTEGLQIELFKGAGDEKLDEHRLWNLPRNGNLAPFLGKFIKRNGYVVEQLSSFLPFVYHIKKGRPDIIFYSDSNLGFQLYWWRKQIGVPYRLVFSNGGPCNPPFSRTDYVQQVAPFYREQALEAGESPSKHFLVPYGINVPNGDPLLNHQQRQNIKQRLGLPCDRPIIISVGWISATHKRMNYVVDEVAALPEPRPYLVMLGYMDESSEAIVNQATLHLGKQGFTALSVPYEQVSQYYQVADIFVLGSLQEGFGRVYLEALIHGLPCVANDHPVMRYVLGSQGTFADLSKPGSMTQAIAQILQQGQPPQAIIHRREYVRERFSWKNLTPAYMEMFHACLAQEKDCVVSMQN
ncbi:glycosyltransferase family 4 protein [Nostoc sphaeroides CHAB 2801]|uniref:glycosyltransferase family 4 protein n=1 Tax=Nostoc sphaeroides TaxID=446679 RepID=UPI001E5E849A|nr:glycosyltransferase family 4 protein [Nostoc sphaeroides]MCC5632343.1 glycosyltransferase family 4 protein [Nostoc sphaeroides CHAB 2801]